MSAKRGTLKWQQATTSRRRRKQAGEWVSNGDLYRAIAKGYDYFLAQRTRTAALAEEAKR